MGAAIIGVAAVPANIVKADLKSALIALGRVKPVDEPSRLQHEIGRHTSALLKTSGPTGWERWTAEYRNMVVHRARRLQFSKLTDRSIYNADGLPFMQAIPLLPNEPGLSDMEMFVSDGAPLLTEAAEVTVEGTFASTVKLVEGVAALLITAWERRRARPSDFPQPASQWPPSKERLTGFAGYKPGTTTYVPQAHITNDDMVDRLKAAGLQAPRLTKNETRGPPR